MATFCKYYKADAPGGFGIGSVKNRRCEATGQAVDEYKAKRTCTSGDYSKCLDWQKKK
ncbi:hypothetical protein AGMMS49983_10030 [Clostridia bacterium]|nr:hypothetical protein AGMMS49983_10030 [Clostridia bacterium]